MGQVGFDARYPFIKRGKNINLIVEPRVQLTNSFGSSKLSKFQAYQDSSMITSINPTEINYLSTQQDGQDIDLTEVYYGKVINPQVLIFGNQDLEQISEPHLLLMQEIVVHNYL